MRMTASRTAWAGPARDFRGRPDDRVMDDPPSRIGSVQCRHHGVDDAAVDVNRRIAVGLRGLVADRRHRPVDAAQSSLLTNVYATRSSLGTSRRSRRSSTQGCRPNQQPMERILAQNLLVRREDRGRLRRLIILHHLGITPARTTVSRSSTTR
jgi:hypothetical protein